MSEYAGELTVVASSEKGVKCSVASQGDDGEPFWLPRYGHVKWGAVPEAGKTISVIVPDWLATKHHQLGGEATDVKRDIARPLPQTASTSERDMAGTLAKNQRKVDLK